MPIDSLLPDVVDALRRRGALVLQAATGAGKTTRVPPALLDAGLATGQIVVLQPRRLAARAAAARMADERGGRLGDEVGYHVRFDHRASPRTKILCVTEGMFLRRLQDDPLLESTSVVIFDEFHERSLDADLALAMVQRVRSEVRPDLKLIVMSATLDVQPVARHLDAPLLTSAGRLHPVELRYLDHEPQQPLVELVAGAILRACDGTTGDVLTFLPGVGEIRRVGAQLASWASQQGSEIVELYGDLPLERQQAALRPGTSRRVILATNVAETSVTVPGVTIVVDSGLRKTLRLDPRVGLNRLETERISQASATQRAGRAGRTAPGVCWRLWTARQQQALAEVDVPEIRRVEMAGQVLQLLAWGEGDILALPWLEPPPRELVDQALVLLQRLGAYDGQRVTELGRTLARLPVHPRLARLVVEGHRRGHPRAAALAAAMLSERDPFAGPRGAPRRAAHHSASDVVDRVAWLLERGESPAPSGGARWIVRAGEQLLRTVEQELGPPPADGDTWETALQRGLAAAFPDRLARRRANDVRRGRMVGGRGVRLADESAVAEAELFVCVELEETGRSESLVRQASAVDRAWLDERQLATSIDVEFHAEKERLVAWRRTRWDDLVLDESAAAIPPDFDAAPLLAREAAARWKLIDLLDDASRNLLARIELLAAAFPEEPWPRLDAAGDWLWRHLCTGCTSLAEVRRRSVAAAILAELSPPQQRALAERAPERLLVPSGNRIPLRYESGQPPVLAVRIQEIFGWQATPRIAAGRVAVVLELLGPNYRPQQITADLASFWSRGYAEVRKELKRRYPKHAWPENPHTAPAESRPKRR